MRISERLAALLLAVFLSSAALGQDKLTQAREHFDAGVAYFQQKQYDLALKELMQAYVLDPNPALVYNIARVHEDKGDLDNALKFFKSFLTIAPRAKNAAAVKKKVAAITAEIKRRPKTGTLAIASDPPGATVRIDGQVVGQTPFGPAILPAGKHKVEVSLDRFDTWKENVLVISSNASALDLKLRDRPSNVLISTDPPDAEAIVFAPEPRTLGACPCIVELSAGKYRLQVQKAGYPLKELFFVKQPGENLRLQVTLVPNEVTGHLVIQAPVAGAEVRIDGMSVGRTPLPGALSLRPGQVIVEIVAAGYKPWRGTARLETGQTTTVNASLDRIATQVPYIPEPSAGGGQRIAGHVLLWSGVAALLGGGLCTTFSLLDKRTFDNGKFFKLKSNDGENELARLDLTRADAIALEDRAKLLMNTSIGLYAAGGAFIIAGAVLIGTSEPETRGSIYPTLAPVPGGGIVGLDVLY